MPPLLGRLFVQQWVRDDEVLCNPLGVVDLDRKFVSTFEQERIGDQVECNGKSDNGKKPPQQSQTKNRFKPR
jgi:hypothetical protein